MSCESPRIKLNQNDSITLQISLYNTRHSISSNVKISAVECVSCFKKHYNKIFCRKIESSKIIVCKILTIL